MGTFSKSCMCSWVLMIFRRGPIASRSWADVVDGGGAATRDVEGLPGLADGARSTWGLETWVARPKASSATIRPASVMNVRAEFLGHVKQTPSAGLSAGTAGRAPAPPHAPTF